MRYIEIRPGLNIKSDQIIAIESTADGREGYFYEFSKRAKELAESKSILSPMQQRFFFFDWLYEPGYRESNPGIVVSKETNEYIKASLECWNT